ncbi:MAG TPA: TonB-dependent receptor [Cyclobacteriaceae bacterium]|nr:TonB-dependent receptor [Cyclobacteriaceae bacterium]
MFPPFYNSLERDLNYILMGTPYSFYNYRGKHIVFYKELAGENRNKQFDVTSYYSNIVYRFDGQVLAQNDDTPVPGATIFVEELNLGVISSINGTFQFILPPGTYTMAIKSVGFIDQQVSFELTGNKSATYYLPTEVKMLNEVVISGEAEANVREISTGITRLNNRALKILPAFLGEVDIVKSLLLLPGVNTVGEAASGFNVRGGSADQNLVIMDEAPLFNSSHIFGLFSIFNQDVVDNLTLMRSGISPRYGGRLSSVLDVKTRNGQSNRITGQGGIGLFNSRLTLDAPVIRDRLKILAGGRILYSDFLLGMLKNKALKNSSTFFYDGNIKINLNIHKFSRLDYSFYSSFDQFRLPSDTLYHWGTNNHSLNYHLQIGKKLVLNSTGIRAHYRYGISEDQSNGQFQWNAGIQYQSIKLDFYYQPDRANKIEFGCEKAWHEFSPGDLEPGPDSYLNSFRQEKLYARENIAYVSDEIELLPFLSLAAGLRYSAFGHFGPGTVHLYEPGVPRNIETMIASTSYGRGEKISLSDAFEPRISARIMLNELSSIKASYNRLYQYIQQVSNTTGITPIDLWYPSSIYLKPQACDQVTLGYYKNFQLNRFETSVELYYKRMDNLVDYKEWAELFLNPHIETELLQGKGMAYGIELYARKNLGRVTGWASYTYARSLIRIKGSAPEETINQGAYYPTNFDMPNEVKITTNYQINRRWSIAGNFVYLTGRPVTFPASKYEVNKITIASYEERNGARIPDYHRLDVSITQSGSNRKNKYWYGSWSFTVYNLYARKNAYSIYFKPIPGSRIPQAYRYTILGTIIPSLSYNFKFL